MRSHPALQAARRFTRNRTGVAALATLVALVLVGLLAPVLAPFEVGSSTVELITKPQAPLAVHGHLLGTDVLGHDLLTQLLFGLRESIVSALVCAAGAAAIGAVAGVAAAWYGGWVDRVVTWVTGLFAVVPAIAVMLILLVYSHWPITPFTYALWLMLLLWTGVARAVRGAVMTLRVREYVAAAEASGASELRIMARHLLPNATGPLLVAATTVVAQSVLIIATVTFLGYASTQSEKPSLGILIAQGAQSIGSYQTGIFINPWWLYVIPGAVIALLLTCTTVLADALDESLNPVLL